MTSLRHGTFTIPLELPAEPARVFAAFSEPDRRARWVRMPGPSSTQTRELDFRAGGTEVLRNEFVSGDLREELENRIRFIEIVPDERIVFTSESVIRGVVRWVSLITVELAAVELAAVEPAAMSGSTHLDWTEQYAFLVLSDPDGTADEAHLKGGTRLRLNGLAAAIAD